MIILGAPDQIRSAGHGDMTREARGRIGRAMEHQEKGRPVDVRPPVLPDRLPKRASCAIIGDERFRRERDARWRAHSIRSRAVAAVKAIKRRIASSSAESGSPLHSSMKNFLNSSAIAHPRIG